MSLMRALIPFLMVPPSRLNYLSESPPSNTITLGVNVSKNELEGTYTFSPQYIIRGHERIHELK